MAKNTKKRTVIYSNVKENKKLAEERAEIRKNQINLNDEIIIGFNSNKSTVKKIDRANPVSKKNKKNIKNAPHKKNEGKVTNNKAKNNKRAATNQTEKTKQQRKATNQTKKTKQQREVINQTKKIKQQKVGKNKQQGNEIYNNQPKEKMSEEQRAKMMVVVKILIAIIILAVIVIGLMKAPILNIKEISVKVDNNRFLTEQEVKELSQISAGQNIFTIKKSKAIKNIKQNSYVESVKIKRSLPNKLEIQIKERVMKFQIEADGKYIFVDAYGIVINQSEEKREGITITGIKTENIVNGEKLSEEDLKALSDAMIIMQEAKNNEIDKDITKIDISSRDDYLIYFDSLGKIAHVGDTTSINDKMVRIVKILEKTVDYEGEIFVNVDLNNKKYPYFREKV